MNSFVKKILILSLCTYLFQGCALTNSQYKTSKQFYSSLKDFDKQCKTLEESSLKIVYERKILFPKTYSNDSVMVNELVTDCEENFIAQYKQDSITIAISQITNYFNIYPTLLPKSSETKGTNRRALSAIEDYSSYLPFGIGLAVYKTVYDAVDYTGRFFKIPHQRKKIKKYITNGERLVPENLAIISKEFLTISSLLENEKTLIKQNYLLFLQNQSINKNPYDYYSVYNVGFLKNYNLALMTLEMSKNMTESVKSITNSYAHLFSETRTRKRFKSDVIGLLPLNTHLGKSKFVSDKVDKAMK